MHKLKLKPSYKVVKDYYTELDHLSSTATRCGPTRAAASSTTPTDRPDDPQYIVRLVGKVITVSLETVKVVEGLPGFG